MRWGALFAVLGACGGGDGACDGAKCAAGEDTAAPTVGTTPPTVPTAVVADTRVRCPTLDTFEVWAKATFPVADAQLDIWEVAAGGHHEGHPLVAVPVTDVFGTELTWRLADEAEPWVGGRSTAFVCGVHDWSTALVYALRVYDEDGVLVDCVAWSPDRDLVDAVLAAPTGDGDVPAATPERVDELASGRCVVF